MAFHVLVYAHMRLTVLVIENACTELVDKQLAEQKDQMQRQYNDAKRQMQEYGIIKQNVDGILRTAPGKEQMQER